MSKFSKYLDEIKKREGLGLSPKPIDNGELLNEIISNKDGALEHLKSGSCIVDHTTTSANLAKEMNDLLSTKNINYLDAPVSGGQAGAESGQLSIMVGGKNELYEELKDILMTYSKFIKYMGGSGSGQLTKMVNQICIAGLLQGLAEGMNFSEKAGLNSSFIVRKISSGIGVERTFQTHSPMIDSIKVKRKGDVRQAKLFYLRDRSGKSARIKERLE